MIKKLAWECLKRLPSRYYTIEELEQEGRIIFVKLRRRRLDGRASFGSLLFTALRNRYADIVREAYCGKRLGFTVELEDVHADEGASALYEIQCDEFIRYIKKINLDLAEFFINGPNEKIKKFAAGKMIEIDEKCINLFFGIDLSVLVKQFEIGRLTNKKGIAGKKIENPVKKCLLLKIDNIQDK